MTTRVGTPKAVCTRVGQAKSLNFLSISQQWSFTWNRASQTKNAVLAFVASTSRVIASMSLCFVAPSLAS